MKVTEFVKEFQEKKIMDTKINTHAVSDYIKENLNIKTYLPFRVKRQIVETVVSKNIEQIDGVKKVDPFNEYVGFVVAMLGAHTSLEFSEDPVTDYDLLAESKLLPLIIAEFQESYDECNILLKMARDIELSDNNLESIIARFLDSIFNKLDVFSETLKNTFGDINIKDIIGDEFKEEDLTKLKGFLDKYNK